MVLIKHANKNGYKQANIHSETFLQKNSEPYDTLHAVRFKNSLRWFINSQTLNLITV